MEEAVAVAGSDRGVTPQQELENLALYAHGQKQINAEDIRAVLGDEARRAAKAPLMRQAAATMPGWTLNLSGYGRRIPRPPR